jgi:hypothetical protein
VSNAPSHCSIRNCDKLANGAYQFCITCAEFPCTDLLHLAKRYRANYGVNIVANLLRIQSVGVERFAVDETVKWSCPGCGASLCMHKAHCPHCGRVRRGDAQ